MRSWDAARVARAAGARLLEGEGPPPVRGPVRVVIDSREVEPGDLFVGLRGEREDGGGHAARALAAGAWGVLVGDEHTHGLERDGHAVMAHEGPLAGLQSLARAWLQELRRAHGARVVAITGSTGKTSTKDILAALLAAPRGAEGGAGSPSAARSRGLRTVASPENFNTEIGLPLAILAAPADTEALVLELAMRGPGQIAELTAIAEPDVGVIVNVGPVHLELLGSLEAIAAAKSELIAGLAPGASVVVPAREPLLEPHLREDLRTVSFGPGGDLELAERAADGWVVILDGTSANMASRSPTTDRDRENTRPLEPARIVLRPTFAQAHNLSNLLAAVAAARALGVTPDGEVSVRFSALRGERVSLPGGIVLIDDCYNANPMSMRAALDDLAETAPGRRVAVLGDMLELGPDERSYHREIGAYARARVDMLVTVGPLATEIGDSFAGEASRASARARNAAPREVHGTPDAPAAADLLRGLLRDGDTVLVKGSRGVGLERVAQALAAAPADAATGRR